MTTNTGSLLEDRYNFRIISRSFLLELENIHIYIFIEKFQTLNLCAIHTFQNISCLLDNVQ